MSTKDMLGPVTRALVGVSQEHLGIFADLANKVGGKDGQTWFDNLTMFVRNGGRMALGDLKLTPVQFDPVSFIGEGWKVLPEEHDARNDGLTEVDFGKADFVHCMNDGEDEITGEEKLKRLKASGVFRWGLAVAYGLWLDYQSRKENGVLEELYRKKKLTYTDFFGDVLLSPGGRRDVLYFYRNDGRWSWDVSWLDNGWYRADVSAVSQVDALVSESLVS